MIAYVSIGNSDDKLSQQQWAAFHLEVGYTLNNAGALFHGEFMSVSTSMFQNACWCIELHEATAPSLKARLAALTTKYGQDSIAWAEAPHTEFLSPQR